MFKKSHYLCESLFWITLSIMLLVTYGAPANKTTCSLDITETNAEGFKRAIGDKLRDDMAKEYLKLIMRNVPKISQFYRSLLPDLPADDKHTELIQNILKESSKYENLTMPTDQKDCLGIINKFKKLSLKANRLNSMETDNVSRVEFRAIQEKHNIEETEQSIEQIKFFENTQIIWKEIYDCIPEEYLKQFKEFDRIEELYQRFLNEKDDREKLHIDAMVFNELEHFFDNGIDFVWSNSNEISSEEDSGLN